MCVVCTCTHLLSVLHAYVYYLDAFRQAVPAGILHRAPLCFLSALCLSSGLAAGMAIGIVGDAGVRAVGQQERLFVGMILILIFAEALGLYGMIVALILSQQTYSCS